MHLEMYLKNEIILMICILVMRKDSMQNPYMEDFAYTNLSFAQICRFWQRMEDGV